MRNTEGGLPAKHANEREAWKPFSLAFFAWFAGKSFHGFVGDAGSSWVGLSFLARFAAQLGDGFEHVVDATVEFLGAVFAGGQQVFLVFL